MDLSKLIKSEPIKYVVITAVTLMSLRLAVLPLIEDYFKNKENSQYSQPYRQSIVGNLDNGNSIDNKVK